ncbi:MAG: 6-phosphogluconolactonase [Pseudomonadota bacterium]
MAPEWRVYKDCDSLLEAALEVIRQSEADSGSEFAIVLAGGQTPLALYRMLARAPMQWQKWQVYFGDERCLPQEDPERNSYQARQALLRQVPIPARHIHIPPAEHGATEAAASYCRELSTVGTFDLVLLGLGEDGHTASLFPGHDIGLDASSADVLPVFDAPKPPRERISLSARRLSLARTVMFLVTGASKREALMRWRQGRPIPASRIDAQQRHLVLADRAAWPDGVMTNGGKE